MSDYVHPVFGPLRHDPEFGEWIGSLEFGGRVVKLALQTGEEEEIPSEFEDMYRALFPKLPSIFADAVKWVLSDLSHWLTEEEDKSVQVLSSQVCIEVVEIFAGDCATVWFHGPDTIFESGHAIEGRVGAGGTLDHFCLSG